VQELKHTIATIQVTLLGEKQQRGPVLQFAAGSRARVRARERHRNTHTHTRTERERERKRERQRERHAKEAHRAETVVVVDSVV
jgi:adenine/guanine phosphoribosyltransferase-like PRPP-binding protein